jgi:regulator of RNase E activity RraA
MIGDRRNPSASQADPKLIEGFKTAATAVISDNLHRMPGALGIRPFHRGGTMVGTALTVRTRSGDNLAIHQALNLVRPGDVVVVDAGGDTSRAVIGEIINSIAEMRGAVGIVLDGALRDASAIAKSDFPCFARAVSHLGPYKNGPGEVNVPVSIGGLIIDPGDIVVGDDDGIVAFPQSIAVELLKAVRAQDAKEMKILQSIRGGAYEDVYGKPGPAS